jgi:hypothetical protein
MKTMSRIHKLLTVFLACYCAFSNGQEGSVPPVVIDGVSLPYDFPDFTPTINEGTAPGHIFITNSVGMPYLMILKNDGSPYFYKQLEESSSDFKLQDNGMLSCWISGEVRGFMLMDEHFQIIDTLKCQNGFDTDQHDLQLLSNGHALMIAIEERNMTEIDPEGNPNATVIGNHIQEINESGNVVFEWLCWDHIALEDSYLGTQDIFRLDYIHINSIAVDFDGHLLISCRHLSECTKINRQTGEIIWRLGGKNNQFDFINDPDPFSFQHDFRPVPGKPGYYTLYDNGNQRDPRYSRALEYKLDTVNMIAEKVWEYRHSPDRYSRLMGNAQRLPNGNTVISWGDPALPAITEVTPDSLLVYEAILTPRMNNYRSFRFECDYSMLSPYLLAEPYPDRIRLLFNKFGDTGVDYFNIYAGKNPDQLDWIDSTSQTWMDLLDLDNSEYSYLEVTAVDSSGLESMPSNQEKVYVRNSQPGDNLILNGDFSDGENFWTHQNFQDANSSGSPADSIYRFNITAGGLIASDVQLSQAEIPLIQGKEYILELDARADAPRTIGIEVERDDATRTSYSRHGLSYIGTQFTHIEHTFTMDQGNDLGARFVIYGGGSDIDFEVQNISLRQKVIAGIQLKGQSDDLIKCFPNPANNELQISFQLESASDIDLQLFTLAGQQVESHGPYRQPAGPAEITLNTERLLDGAYLLMVSSKDFKASSLVLVKH